MCATVKNATTQTDLELVSKTNDVVQPKEKGFDGLHKSHQLILLSMVLFMSFGTHNLLQEAMTKVPGFTYGMMLGYLEVLGVTIMSFLERTCIAKERGLNAPISSYPLLTFCLMSSSSLSNLSLNYINFPTKVVFRSCKLLPTMVIASCINKKVFSSVEYMCALSVCTGLVLFAAADWQLTPNFNPIGITYVSLSVVADAVLPNAQENLFSRGCTRLEVTFYSNVFTLMAMTVTSYMSGDLMGLFYLAKNDVQLQLYIVVYIFIAYFAISTFMSIVKRFGAVTGVVLSTIRKGMTIILSFLFFPKEFSWFYVVGGTCVLFGTAVASLKKYRLKNIEAAVQEMQEEFDVENRPLIKK